MKKVKKWFIIGVIFLVMVISLIEMIPASEIYVNKPHDYSSTWMSEIDDSKYLNEIFIPGTHNSGAQFSKWGFFSKCQWDGIYSQLKEGYRYLDIRLSVEDDHLYVTHGDMTCRKDTLIWSKSMTVEDVMNECIRFLNDYPSETIVFVVKKDTTKGEIEDLQLLLNQEIQKNPQYWLLTNQMPTLEQSRGKIVLFRRYEDKVGLENQAGIDIYWEDQEHIDVTNAYIMQRAGLNVQDYYSLSVPKKWDAFNNALHEMPANCLNINFMSSKGPFYLGHPYALAYEINYNFLHEELANLNPQWIVMDFGTEYLANHIYTLNTQTTSPAIEIDQHQGYSIVSLLFKYLCDEFAVISISVLLLIILLRYNLLGYDTVNPIITTVIIALILSFVDYIERILASGNEFSIWRVVYSVIGYSLRPAAAAGILRMTWKDRKLCKVADLLLIFNALVHISAFWFPLAFAFDQNNGFHRGPLGYCSHVISLFFVFIILVGAIRFSKNNHNQDRIVVFICAINCVLVAILSTMGYMNNLLNITILVSCMFYYLYLHLQVTSRDIGTGLYNRQMFYADYKRKEESISGIIGLDMNGLKAINDNYGHDAGDLALKILADVLVKCIGKNGKAYRLGGDEFCIYCFDLTEDEIQNIIQTIRNEYSKSGYSASIGYAIKDNIHSIEALMKKVDEMMYEDKRKYYSQKKDVLNE